MILAEADRAIEGTKSDFADLESKAKYWMTLALAAMGAISYLSTSATPYLPPVKLPDGIDHMYFAPVAFVLLLGIFFLSRSLSLTDFSSGGIRLKDDLEAYLNKEHSSVLEENILKARTRAFERNKIALAKKAGELQCGITLVTMGVPTSLFLTFANVFSGGVFLDGGWVVPISILLIPIILSFWHSAPPWLLSVKALLMREVKQ